MSLSSLFLYILLAGISAQAAPSEGSDPQEMRHLQEESRLEQQAKTFDKYLNGKLTPAEEKALRAECKQVPDRNVFCFSYGKGAKFDKRVKNRLKRPKEVKPKKVNPVVVTYTKKGKIANWKKVRKQSVKAIVKGIGSWPLSQLRALKVAVLKETGCPDNVSVSLGALLEDHFPSEVSAKEIAEVYEKGARCLNDNPADQEHFFTRIGLLYFWQKDFPTAIQYFERNLSIPDAYLPRALYWLYRANDALDQKDKAVSYLDQLIKDYPVSFHAAVAAVSTQRDLGTQIQSDVGLFPTAVRSTKITTMNPFIEQAEVLRKYGFEGSSAFVADVALEMARGAETEVKNYLMDLASAPKKIALAIEYVNKPRPNMHRKILEWYFPAAFSSSYEKQAATIDPYLLMAVTRQESTFNEKAISWANAQGLMQIQPETGYILSKGKRVDLLDPDTNVSLGALYLRLLLKKHQMKAYFVLAAYNAGEDRLTRWMSRYPTQDPLLFIDLISYRETRNYVAAVLRNYYWYRRLYGKNADGLADLIEPKVIRGE